MDGVLYKHVWNNVGRQYNPTTSPWKLCFAREARADILKQNHDDPTAGHMGIVKTFTE